jgi:hypothetical protein
LLHAGSDEVPDTAEEACGHSALCQDASADDKPTENTQKGPCIKRYSYTVFSHTPCAVMGTAPHRASCAKRSAAESVLGSPSQS